ncbi:MAG: hypothetical protein H0A76_12310 [Candidatus Thiodubiliella endoseptemdiera]|uniref:Uncharacterized protein n=1 Tax=Candidatus Thiodubiliella endoseptemdiera TaxID=2738886 RepID=A0A853F4I7_9GAMM|nr:hypothetical protein [Candidatus Thiodubiliella endoseptemdiera]
MAIDVTSNRVQVQASSTVRKYDFNFRVFQDTDLEVYLVNRSDATTELQRLSTDYRVVLTATTVGSVQAFNNGSITFTKDLTDDFDVLILRKVPAKQDLVLHINSNFDEEGIEAALDKLTILVQQIEELTNRSLKIALGAQVTNLHFLLAHKVWMEFCW